MKKTEGVKFREREVSKMHRILTEIYSALNDKQNHSGKLSIAEHAWLESIKKVLKSKIKGE